MNGFVKCFFCAECVRKRKREHLKEGFFEREGERELTSKFCFCARQEMERGIRVG